MDTILGLVFIAIFIGLLYGVKLLKSKYKKSFNFRVLTALCIGVVFGAVINLVLGVDSEVTNQVTTFVGIFGTAYIRLLRMMVIPIVFISMLTAIINTKDSANLSKIVVKVIAVLVVTVMIAALVGIASVFIFNIDSQAISSAVGTSESVIARQDKLGSSLETLNSKNYAEYITSFIPTNIFYMLTAQDSTSTLSTVLFAMFTGYGILQVKKRKPEKVQLVIDLANSTKEVVLSMVKEILKLTPFAVLSLITTFVATTSVASMAELGKFLLASYFAIIVMYIIHLIIIMLFGLNPKQFAVKSWPVLLFGFSSRSSMSAVPFNIETQTSSLGVDEETASIAATFGTSIGQNGCAGVYPAMLAVMAAQIMGIPITPVFIIQLVVVVGITSFGVAGVGGGATFAALSVLSIMGLDIRIAALLISIEALIDMARTALNISDSMLAGVVVAKSNKTIDMDMYNK